MLNLKENCILNLFIVIYEMNLKNQVIRNNKDLNIIFDENHIPDKIVDIFFNKIGNETSFILYLSIMYAIGFSEATEKMKYLNFIEYYKEDINNPINLDKNFKRMCLYNAIKYIIKKRNDSVSLTNEETLFSKYKSNFQYINNLVFTYSLRDLEKNILFKILEKYNPSNKEMFILAILNSNSYDNDIIEFSNSHIKTDKDVKFYKNYLLRIIFLDAYIFLNDAVKEKEKELSTLPFFNLPGYITTPELKHINDCINSKNFMMPSQKIECFNIIKAFFIGIYEPEHRRSCLEMNEKTKKKELSLIDPLYKLD